MLRKMTKTSYYTKNHSLIHMRAFGAGSRTRIKRFPCSFGAFEVGVGGGGGRGDMFQLYSAMHIGEITSHKFCTWVCKAEQLSLDK